MPPPVTCMIFGTILNSSGNPLGGLHVEARAIVPQDVGANQLVSRNVSTVTRSDGYFELVLIQGAKVRFVVEDTDFNFTRTVPALATQDIATWDT